MIITPWNRFGYNGDAPDPQEVPYVVTFNGRVGSVDLTAEDIENALGYIPGTGGGTTGPVDWADITGKPSTFTPSAHTHVIADVTGLQTALDGKQPVGSYITLADLTWTNISGKPTTFTPSAHTHPISDVINLQTALDGKSNVGHTHVIADVTNLQTTLDGKLTQAAADLIYAPISHTQAYTTVTGVGTGTVFYRKTAGTGAAETQTLATLKTDLGLTGTNSGDQTITLSGAVSGSGTGAITTTLGTGIVGLSNMANVATGTVFYRKTASSGAPEVQTLATLKTDLGLTGTNSGDQTITLSGAVSGSGTGAITTTLGTGVVGLSNMANVNSGTVFYRKTASAGAPETQTLATLKTDLGLTGTNSGDQTSIAGITGTIAQFNAALTDDDFATGGGTATGTNTGDQTITLTGPVTGSGTGSFATTITDGAVTLAKMANVASGTVFYRKTASSGVPEVQTLATLKTDLGLTGTNSGDQTITLTGDVTGSGTGSFATTITKATIDSKLGTDGTTATFYRKDGTWALPPGGGTGLSNPQTGAELVRIENVASTVPAGAAGIGLELVGNNASGGFSVIQSYDRTGSGFKPILYRAQQHDFYYSSSPTTVQADSVSLTPQRLAASAGGVMPRWRTEDGTYTTPQAHLGRNTVGWGQAVGNATTAITFNNMPAMTAVGTATARNVATTSRLTRAKRLGYVTTAATAGLACGLYNTVNQHTTGGAGGGGFRAVFRFAISDASLVAASHALIGMRNATTAPSVTANPNTLTNVIGLAVTNGSANWQIVYGGSAAQTPVDTGIAVNNTDLMELMIYARPDDATKVAVRVENITTGASFGTLLSAAAAGTQLPANTTLLGPIVWRSNNATAAQAAIDISSLYIESDI